jgi:hypothetical protein
MFEIDIWRCLIGMDEMGPFLVGWLVFTDFIWRVVNTRNDESGMVSLSLSAGSMSMTSLMFSEVVSFRLVLNCFFFGLKVRKCTLTMVTTLRSLPVYKNT